MSKYLWVLLIVFTLVLIKVANNPKDSFAIDADPNQITIKAQIFPLSDVNETKTPPVEDANSTKELNKTKDETSKEEATQNQISPEKEPAEEPKAAETKKNQGKLSKTQNKIQNEFASIFADYVHAQGNINYSKLRRQRLV